PAKQKRPPFWIYDRLENRTFFSLQHLSQDNVPAYADELARVNPRLIVGYPTAIYLVAFYLCDAGISSIRPSGVFTASETLLSHQRKTIEQAFGCKVMDLYGQCECTGMIMQCAHGNYHVQEEYGVVEILDGNGTPAKPGETGELICTGLNN